VQILVGRGSDAAIQSDKFSGGTDERAAGISDGQSARRANCRVGQRFDAAKSKNARLPVRFPTGKTARQDNVVDPRRGFGGKRNWFRQRCVSRRQLQQGDVSLFIPDQDFRVAPRSVVKDDANRTIGFRQPVNDRQNLTIVRNQHAGRTVPSGDDSDGGLS